MLQRRSKKTLPKLKHEAEAVFHKWILARDKNICYTCNKEGDEAGHFRHNKLDFDEMNLHCQCSGCNCFRHGNLGLYAIRLIKDYGQDKVDDLIMRSNQALSNKYTRQELEALKTKYQLAKLDNKE